MTQGFSWLDIPHTGDFSIQTGISVPYPTLANALDLSQSLAEWEIVILAGIFFFFLNDITAFHSRGLNGERP